MAIREDLIEAIAGHAELERFPWAELEAQGKGLRTSDAYLDVLEGQFNRYFQVLFRLDIPELKFTQEQSRATAAYEALGEAISLRAAAVLTAIGNGEPFVAAREAVEVRSDILRIYLVVLNAITWRSWSAHDAGEFRNAVIDGRMSLDEAKASAADVYALWGAVVKLYEDGSLDYFKRAPFRGTSGLGLVGLGVGPAAAALPVGAWVAIALFGVGVVAILSWSYVTLKVEDRRTGILEKTCFDPKTGALLDPLPPHCGTWLDNLAKDPNAHLKLTLGETFGKAFTTFAWIAGVGILIYVGAVYVLPAVLATRRRPAAAAA